MRVVSVSVLLQAPVVDPDAGAGFRGLRERDPGARRALLVHQPAVPRIGDRRVREQDLSRAEGAGIILGDVRPCPEERDLEADRPIEPAGDVPPLRAEIRMRAVIARERKLGAWFYNRVICLSPRPKRNRQSKPTKKVPPSHRISYPMSMLCF